MSCGVLGVVLKDKDADLSTYARIGLGTLNHRGEDSHGVAFLDTGKVIETRKDMGLVRDSSRIFEKPMNGSMLVGHTRYITSSGNSMQNTQPIPLTTESGLQYAVSHNGNIANDQEIKSFLRIEQDGISDTITLGRLLGRSIGKESGAFESIRDDLSRVVGSYSLAILIGGKNPKLIATRDKFGYMPLFFGQNGEGFFVASESVSFAKKNLNAAYRPIAPGEMLVIDKNEVQTYQLFESNQKQFCMFQWLYMCRPDSQFENTNVYEARANMGMIIANNYKPNVDCIVPVPDSGRAVAYGYNQATGISMVMGLVRNPYESKRSFMQGDQQSRVEVVNRKLNVNAAVVRGKRILLMDDSVVRGTTMASIINELREAGAREVHVALSCPPIISQCYFGIDFYNDRLSARPFRSLPREGMNISMASKIGANSLYYPSTGDLVSAIGIRERDLCLSCLNENYLQNIVMVDEQTRKK